MSSVFRSRLTLLLVVSLFFVSFGIAAALIFSGWKPSSTRNFGELLATPIDLGAVQLNNADGSSYGWEPKRRLWRIVVLPPPACSDACIELIDTLQRVWISEGRHADRVEVLWFGEVPKQAALWRTFRAMQPSPALRQALPAGHDDTALPVYLIDPSGFLVMRYAPGFDPTGLRKDLARLLKVTE